MSENAIASDIVAICLSRQELQSRGYSETLSPPAARRLILEALKDKGEEPWEDMEVEIFSCDDALLVMARPAWNEYHLFYFSDGETLINAAVAASGEFPASLGRIANDYVLCIRAGEDELPPALFEYGYHERNCAEYITHLREQGQIIVDGDALNILRQSFL